MKQFLQNRVLHMLFYLCLGVMLFQTKTQAAGQSGRPVVVLGADLTADQRETVLNQMGLTEKDLETYTVVTITNEQEHQYLDQYLEKSVIGKKSLSSVLLTPADKGNGVLVTTQNINYCTNGMYRNALLTAGMEDTNVFVTGPTEISGTAALIGAIKGYEAMTGNTVSDQTIDTAMNELITTGTLETSEDSEDSEDIEQLVAYVKAKVAAGELDNEEEIRQAIGEGENKFDITLTEEEKQQIITVMNKIKELGLDPQKLLDQAADLYEKFGDDFLDHTGELVKDNVDQSVTDYFIQMGERVKSFFVNLFGN